MIYRLFKKYIKSKIDDYTYNKFQDLLEREYPVLLEKAKSAEEWKLAVNSNKSKLLKVFTNGVKAYCYTDSLLCKAIYLKSYDENELSFLENYLRKGDEFIDVGANIGLYSLHAAKIVTDEGRIFAFEPSPETFNRLAENIKLNNLCNVELFQIALSNKKEVRNFTISTSGFDAWNSLTKPSMGVAQKNIEVECLPLDDFQSINKQVSKADLMKIDVEGWELYMLQGGKQYFTDEDAPVLLIEFTDENARSAGTTCQKIYKYLNELGYKLYKYNAADKTLKFSPMKEYYHYDNLIATKNIVKTEMKLGIR